MVAGKKLKYRLTEPNAKKLKKAPFGSCIPRFDYRGVNPSLDPTRTGPPRPLCAGCYDTKRILCIHKGDTKSDGKQPWKRKMDLEMFSASWGFRGKDLRLEKLRFQAMRAPGHYDINEELYKSKSFSVGGDRHFGTGERFKQFEDNIPGPGSHNIEKYKTIPKPSLSKTPTLEYDGLKDRFRSTDPQYQLPSNLYNSMKNYKATDRIMYKLVSKRGPYDTFTGPRDDTTIKGYFEKPKMKKPETYYVPPGVVEALLLDKTKAMHGKFLQADRFPTKPTMRLLLNDISTCYKHPEHPGPGSYNMLKYTSFKYEPRKEKYDFITTFPVVGFECSSSDKQRTNIKWTLSPGPGRYNVSSKGERNCSYRKVKGTTKATK